MIPAYDKTYLEIAQTSLGTMLDYAVNDAHVLLEDFWAAFLRSPISKAFETGDSSTIAGQSGVELARLIICCDTNQTYKNGRTREYWTGWALAYYQWLRNISFNAITVPILDIRDLYNPYHEMDILQFCDKMDELLSISSTKSNLKRIREQVGISQSELALLSGVPLRTIQQYEQKQKNINGARSEYIIMLSKALMCDPESLLE